MNLGPNWGPLVCTLSVIFIYVLKVRYWCFCAWHFCTNRIQIQRCSTSFNIFALALKFGIFARNFKISFLVSRCFSNHCPLPYNITRRATMVSIWRPYDGTGSRDTDPIILIQCINGQQPMYNELWSHGLDGLSCDVHPTARAGITPVTDREFFNKYLTNNGHHIIIIWKSSVNGSVKFTGIP